MPSLSWMHESWMHERNEIPDRTFPAALEPGRAGKDIPHTIPLLELVGGSLDFQVEGATEHPEMVFQAWKRRYIVSYGRSHRQSNFHQLALEMRIRRRDNAADVAGLGVLPGDLLFSTNDRGRSLFGFRHEARDGPAVLRAQDAEHGGGGAQFATF